MKILLIFLCVWLLITALPMRVQAEDEDVGLSWTRPSRMVTTGILGATVGVLVGAVVAVATASSSGSPIAIGAGVGLALGVLYAYMTPTEEVVEESTAFRSGDGGPALPPPGQAPQGAEAGAFR